MGTAGWAQAEADRARIRTVLRAPPDWRAPATTSVPASTTKHGAAGAPIAAPADIVRNGGHTLDPAQPRAGEQAETIAKHGISGSSASPPYLDHVEASFGAAHDLSSTSVQQRAQRNETAAAQALAAEHPIWQAGASHVGNQAQLRQLAAKAPVGANLILQRKCAYDAAVAGPTGECARCSEEKPGPQTKLRIDEPGDAYEREADRVADR